ncbi:AAA family ATPase [Breoghania sp.]|uniref:AAA family ATPase n=1 Tax=Breoghania sp. TaxID=2065378 RepID=UPI0026199BFB|nr:AAA family ATPase [Breoghania sp.]MDJ0932949.1 AAA family ATPase [Breoghania sp.]
MRIERLDLTRYGKFTDHALEFGPRGEGPDFHIVYGPNEAGKSTLLSAWLDLLYSIPMKSKYNFLHSYDAMRIGAKLQLDADTLTLARIKKQNQSLLDDADRPLPEGLLQAALGGVDRDAYRTMFSLDDETLETGGDAILASEGDLGQLLFSASSGLAAFSHTLADLREKASGIHRKNARNTELRALRTRLDDLTTQRKDLDTTAAAYNKLAKDRDAAKDAYESALSEGAALKRRIAEISALRSALPRLAQLRALRADLDPLKDVPEAPLGWADALPGLIKDETRLAERSREAARRIETLSEELAAIVPDETALALAARIDALSEQVARQASFGADLPEERLKLGEAQTRIAHILQALERADEPDPDRLIVPAASLARLRTLMETRSGIARDVETARRERDATHEAEIDAQKAAENAGARASDGTALANLKATLSALRSDDHAARRRLAERNIAQARERLDEQLAALSPWQGDADALARLSLPSDADIRDWQAREKDLRETLSFLEERAADQSTKLARLEAERDALENAAGLFNEAAAAQAHEAREIAWTTHRAKLDAATADAFRTALKQDDALTAARLAQSTERADHRRMTVELAGLTAEATETRKRMDTAREKSEALIHEIAAALRHADPALAGLSLSHLEAWLAARATALETRTEIRRHDGDLKQAIEDGKTACTQLAAALTAAGETPEPDVLLDRLTDRAEILIDAEAQMKRLREDIDRRRAETERREQALNRAQEVEQAWQTDWAATCARFWFVGANEPPSPDIVRALLDQISDLAPALETRKALVERIDAMEADAKAFTDAARALAEEMGLAAEADSHDLSRTLADQAAAARKAQERLIEKREALEEERKAQHETEEVGKALAQRKAEMTAHFAVESLDEVARKLEALARRKRLAEQTGALESEIVATLDAPDLAEAEARLDKVDRAALTEELEETKRRAEDHDQHTRELFSAQREADKALAAVGGGGDAVARLEEERGTVLLEIEEKARDWLRLQAGILTAEQALRAYRDRHQSSMMDRASRAFAEISRGAHSGLTTQADGDREVLIGLDHAGRSKLAAEMSKGTRFQLYLALRIAGYYEFVANRASLPFIADDILETFDDDRARETIRLLAEMGEKGQVVHLTHHPHLCEIARQVCPQATVHELPDPLTG